MGIKGGKAKIWRTAFIILAILVLVGGIYGYTQFSVNGEKQTTTGGYKDMEIKNAPQGSGTVPSTCPTTGTTSLTVDVQNLLNTTGTEGYDTTVYVLTETGDVVATLSDTTSPSATSINCGYKYLLKAVVEDGASKDNSAVIRVLAKPANSDVALNNGVVSFTADRGTYGIKLGLYQHGTLQFKMYDNTNARYAYNNNSAVNTAFVTGSIFEDGTNSSAFAVSANGFIDATFKIQGVQSDTDFTDAYTLVGLKAPVDKWNEPTIRFDGQTLSNMKDSLTSDEKTAMNAYQYVYKITKSLQDDIHAMDFYMQTCAGCDPTADLNLDFVGAGNYLSTDGTSVKIGAYKDDSSHSAVFTSQNMIVDIS